MSFIAGYFTKKNKLEHFLLEEKVKSFSILIGEEPHAYKNLVIETDSGCVIQKCKKEYPIRSEPCKDINGNLLVRLGFFYPSESTGTDEKLLALCVRSSAEVLEECEGEFIFIFSDRLSGQIHIINDRFAARPFYILQNDDYVYFSSNLAFLLFLDGSKHFIDILGWFQVFNCSHTCGTRTTIKDVKRLKPGTHLTISSNGIQEKQYWCLKHEPATDLDPVVHSAQVFEAFQASTTLRAKLVGKGIVALSGGLDSRLVAAALPEGVDFSAFTFVNSVEASSTVETQVAAEVCKVLGLTHRIVPIAEQKFSQVAGDVIRLTGGLRPFHHMAIVISYIDEIKRNGMNFLLGGGPGDVLAGSYIPSLAYLDPNKIDVCISEFCRRRASRTNHLALLFRNEIWEEYSRHVYTSLLDSFQDITGPTAAHRVTAWAMRYRQPAFTFTSLIHNHPDVTEAFSHLDYKYCDLMLKSPADWLYKENFYAFMIYNRLTRLKHIIYANTGKPLPTTLMNVNYRQGLSNRIIRKFSRLIKFIHTPIATAVSPGFYYSMLRSDEVFLEEIVDCLHSYSSLREILDTEKCVSFVKNFRSGNLQDISYNAQTELLGSLASMCLSYKYLI